MKHDELIDPKSFAAKFRDEIRVGFNWDRMFHESWPIEVVALTSPNSFVRCFMPWYIGKSGNEVAYDDPEAHPISLADVPKVLGILNIERQDDIHRYANVFQEQKHAADFCVPSYALPKGQHFILDRNHRLAALTLATVPFSVTLWNVRGPLEPNGLLDLIHWMPK